MKILFYNHTGKASGAEGVLLMILAKIDRQRFQPIGLCPSDGSLAEMITQLGVKTFSIEPLVARFTWRPFCLLRYVASFFRLMRQARAVVTTEDPQIIHANSIRAGLVMSVATMGLAMPVVWHVHDILPHHPLSGVIRLIARASRRTHVVAVSVAVANRFRGLLFRRPIAVIHNAVDVELFHPNTRQRQETRQLLGFAEKDLILGAVGQLTPRKGQLELIKAFAEIAPDFPNTALAVVGEAIFNRDSEYAASLYQTAAGLGIADRVYFLGRREDVTSLMRVFDLLVANSRVEPFGLTAIEAMASGTTVLATAVDGFNEMIEHGRSGWLVEAGNHQELIAGIRALLSNTELRTQLSTTALSEARLRFTVPRYLNDIQNFYSRTATPGGTPQSLSARGQAVKLSAE